MAETTFVPQSPYQAFLQSPNAANCRITLVSGQPVMTSNALLATQVFITPYLGARIPFYNPNMNEWRSELFSEMAIQLSLGTGAQQVTTASNYDVYAWLSGGQPTPALSPAWASDTSLGTNPGSAERINVGGVLLNRWAITGGPPAQRGTYLGTIRTGTSAAVDWQYGTAAAGWGPAIHGVYNYFNRKRVSGALGDLTVSWAWTSTAWRPAGGNSTTARVSAIVGVNEDAWSVTNQARAFNSAANGIAGVGVGLDQVTSNAAGINMLGTAGTTGGSLMAQYNALAGIGFHFWEAVEMQFRADTTATFSGSVTSAAGTGMQSGMTYEFLM